MKQALNLGMEFEMKGAANRISILLLEESEQMAFLAEFFIARGFRILTARTGQEALAYYQTGTPEIDVLISDITFPGLSECIAAIRRLHPDIRVLCTTSVTTGTKFLDLENFRLIQKPVDIDKLLDAVTSFVPHAAQ